ncbi:MAG: hypothetical protein AAF823_02415 [Planctomycetota bacterium]
MAKGSPRDGAEHASDQWLGEVVAIKEIKAGGIIPDRQVLVSQNDVSGGAEIDLGLVSGTPTLRATQRSIPLRLISPSTTMKF